MNLFKTKNVIPYVSSKGDKVYPIIMDIKTGIVEGDAVFTTGDIDTAYLYVTILEEQSEYNILGSTVICNIQRPNGTTMKVQGDVLGNNLIEFPLGQSGVSQEGIYNFDIAVVFSEKKMVTSPTAQYSVTQSIEVIGEIEEDDRFPVLESLISGINVINEEELVRVSNEGVRQSKEEAREQAESVRVRNEETRLANNEAIRNEEAVRVTNENERKNAESLRVQEENKRKQQENTRIAQENTRVSQEAARVNAENTRKNQEATRQANEATRVSQETNRSQAESTRNNNETVRQNQENTRKNQEQARVTAEGNRVTSENVRVSAEQARVLKEQERQAIEVERQNSESTREQQEATRVSQENARKQADLLRQQEHESRQQFLDGFEGKLNTVVDDVAGIKDDVVSVKEANKRQDVFLQGLYNENLDGRVTVKEEGSVISLTNSDNGLVDITGLEGNTLVNYVQDGAKELTLNNETNIQGTNVTLTDTVDNGLVDVMCEGNTLVNLCRNKWDGNNKNMVASSCRTVKSNTNYTVISLKASENNRFGIYNLAGSIALLPYGSEIIRTFNTGEHTEIKVYGYNSVDGMTIDFPLNSVMIFEGDLTQTPELIPTEYFEGMKSVGECEDNKIEILSQNKNLFDGLMEYGLLNTSTGLPQAIATGIRSVNYTKVEPSNTYTVSNTFNYSNYIHEYDEEKNYIKYHKILTNPATVTLTDKTHYIKIRTTSTENECDLSAKFQIEKGNTMTSYVQQSINKKEITLSEPLRALPNGVKDKIVKIGGKWYVERNCGEVVLDGSQDCSISSSNGGYPSILRLWVKNISNLREYEGILCDKLPVAREKDYPSIFCTNGLDVHLPLSNDTSLEVAKQWLSENPIKVVYQLATPIYEELPIEPTLNTYNDITHISNNSTIPCNMKITNTGYNAIIKPSTQYTVAFDTDKSGEVGINLAGTKVTTTNNVATVTTPSTLTDDTLRLYGKGIKASKIRLLEGDKTNWIPSHFEGMKSSFEDKLQDDGTYKIEITSTNTDNTLSNKIQLSSIEPLRGVGNVKDRFVFKDDGKLMIERNCAEIAPSGDEIWHYWDSNTGLNTDYISFYMSFKGMNYKPNKDYALISDILIDSNNTLYYRDLKSNSVALNGDKNISLQIGVKKFELQTQDVNGFKQWLKTNKPRITYLLATPIYEEIPYELQKIILEGYKNGTLFLDTNIPPTVEASYTANIPVVSELNKNSNEIGLTQEDLSVTQIAVDFLLMSNIGEEMLSSFNINTRGRNSMGAYFANRILKGALKYEDVISKYPQYKEEIDSILETK